MANVTTLAMYSRDAPSPLKVSTVQKGKRLAFEGDVGYLSGQGALEESQPKNHVSLWQLSPVEGERREQHRALRNLLHE